MEQCFWLQFVKANALSIARLHRVEALEPSHATCYFGVHVRARFGSNGS